jgi:hypothetical protein
MEVIICLGVAIDKLLTMAKHLDRLRDEGTKGLTTLCYAQSSLVALMRTTVQSKLQYGLHLASATAVTAPRKLEQVQNETMRIVTGVAKPTSCDSLCFWLRIQRILHQQQLLMSKECMRVCSFKTHPLKQELKEREDMRTNQRLKTVRSLAVCDWIHVRLDNLSIPT